jgi:hypothetical protein
MLLGLFLLLFVIVKVISQYKYNKWNSKEKNTIIKYRKLPYGVEDQFLQEAIEDRINVFSSSFNSDLYIV